MVFGCIMIFKCVSFCFMMLMLEKEKYVNLIKSKNMNFKKNYYIRVIENFYDKKMFKKMLKAINQTPIFFHSWTVVIQKTSAGYFT